MSLIDVNKYKLSLKILVVSVGHVQKILLLFKSKKKTKSRRFKGLKLVFWAKYFFLLPFLKIFPNKAKTHPVHMDS